MPIRARYAHTNIVARDWRALVDFYVNVFGCERVGAERDHHGPLIDKLTGVQDARVPGIHLRLPGYVGDAGPTLEIFQYNHEAAWVEPAINRRGFAHIAFEVDDVAAAREAVLAAGGRDYGQLVTMNVANAGSITLIYMTDPEGNILELQHWSR